MPSPRKLNPDVPYSVDQIVLECCEKSPDRRYQNMQELSADLKQAISNPDGDFVKRFDTNDMGHTKMITEEEKQLIKKSTQNKAAAAAAESEVGEETDDDDTIVRPAPSGRKHNRDDDYFDEEEEEERENSMDRIAGILTVVAIVIIALIIALIVRIDSPGPAIFKQDRLGRGGKVFKFFKFHLF